MQLSLAGLWQLSPLTDLSIPQDDLMFPNPLSAVLPDDMSEEQIAEQEWHLMHDIEVDEAMLAFPAVDLVMSGIDYHAEVRLNGVALFDCDGSQSEVRKEIRPYLQAGRNRFEILFLEEDEPLIEEAEGEVCPLGGANQRLSDPRMGIWHAPYLQFIRHVRLEHVATEQIWHHGGGCELLVSLHYHTYNAGLVSASVKFNGMTYHLPLDVRAQSVSALFQVEAPVYYDVNDPNPAHLYALEVGLDGQKQHFELGLSESLCVTHFPLRGA
ncbi:hypothetical protein H4F17_06000 [Vibrio cholerae]